MARDEEQRLDVSSVPEDATAHKVALNYVFNPETGEFFPESRDLFSAAPQVHRENVTAVDTEDPVRTDRIDCKGFKRCRFDVDVTGVDITSLKVTLLRWNSLAQKWFSSGTSVDLNDAEGFGASGGSITLMEDEAFGTPLFLKVSEFVGTSFALNAWNILC